MRSKPQGNKTWRFVVLSLSLLLLVAAGLLAWYVYPHTLLARPRAQRHDVGDVGYIPVAARPRSFSIGAGQAFVYDVEEGEILWQKGEDRVVYPASITKLWSILTALQYVSPETVITVGDEVSLIDEDSSLAFVSKGQRLTVEMLIEGMLLPSGNDAAYALAAAVGRVIDPTALDGRAAVDTFVREMNDYAQRSGLCGTVFTTPDGLADEEHYTTVEDMILVCRMALEQPLIAKYAAISEDSVVYESGERITWNNTNQLLNEDSEYYRPCVVGLKTGSLDHNYCVIAACRTAETTYIVGILGAWDRDGRFEDACTIIDQLTE